MISVPGTKDIYPPSRSTSMEPIPAAAPPHQGPKIQPHSSTSPSPMWTYPPVGAGILMTVVATYVSAAMTAAITIDLIFLSDITHSPLRGSVSYLWGRPPPRMETGTATGGVRG